MSPLKVVTVNGTPQSRSLADIFLSKSSGWTEPHVKTYWTVSPYKLWSFWCNTKNTVLAILLQTRTPQKGKHHKRADSELRSKRHVAKITSPKSRRQNHVAKITSSKTRRHKHVAKNTSPKTRRQKQVPVYHHHLCLSWTHSLSGIKYKRNIFDFTYCSLTFWHTLSLERKWIMTGIKHVWIGVTKASFMMFFLLIWLHALTAMKYVRV